MIEAVWQKGFIDSRYSAAVYRYDRYGYWIRRSDHGNRNSEFGWEIDHIVPVSLGGFSIINNLQPLNWQNNVKKQAKLV